MNEILFFDLETDYNKKIADIGAILNNSHFHNPSITEFAQFAQKSKYICGHNITNHDLPTLKKHAINKNFLNKPTIDTLYLSTLLFPQNPYHKLVKDYKLISVEPNNPVSDCKLTKQLLQDTINQFNHLDPLTQTIYHRLLQKHPAFTGFFSFLNWQEPQFPPIHPTPTQPTPTQHMQQTRGRKKNLYSWSMGATNTIKATTKTNTPELIKNKFKEKICSHSNLENLIKNHPTELTYALALIGTTGNDSIFPPWVTHHYENLLPIFHHLRNNRCGHHDCPYCQNNLNAKKALKRIYGFDDFRSYSDEDGNPVPLQENAINAALEDKSFLAVFPTGGGKSLTFQLPALVKGESCRSLTVVISPLQSLMKDQVDILKNRHERTDAVAISGLLSPLERAEAVKNVESGAANILYISPESLRSNTILKIIRNRVIDRFVIDEAHCFSAWGQDFRVDYQYIGEFLDRVATEKNLQNPIPVSCFTATAKPSVIQDIKNYFLQKTKLNLEVFKAPPKRTNLAYGVYHAASGEEKFELLLNLLSQDDKPKIVYTTRVKRSEELAERLRVNGFDAAAYNGRMASDAKIKIQDDFMAGNINIIVATSAFGMGIDKDDVSMVIHYNISDSLENYIQEAGRAGRDKEIKADCFVLFNDDDLMGHFNLLNSTRMNKKEIYQVWQGIKKLKKKNFSRSALELANTAGWDTELLNCEMRVKTALSALEDCGLIKRGQNQTQIFATGLQVKNMEEASARIAQHGKFDENDRLHAARIIKHIISHRDSAVDHMADVLGLRLADTKRLINELKGLGIIGGDKDLTAFIDTRPGSDSFCMKRFETFAALETALVEEIAGCTAPEHETGPTRDIPAQKCSLKDINSRFREINIDSDIESLRTLLFSWEAAKWIAKKRVDRRNHIYLIRLKKNPLLLKTAVRERLELARRILGKLLENADHKDSGRPSTGKSNDTLVEFSILELKRFAESSQLFKKSYSLTAYDKALLYLNDISAIKLDKGLFVHYSPYAVERLNMNNKRQFTNEDYRKLEDFYRHRTEQIHIVGEYAKKLSENYREAMVFVEDYFALDYPEFLRKYFPRRRGRIRKPITDKQFGKIFKDLSTDQLKIINDNQSKAILVAAGPGSGKTRVLVHKTASLLMMEDIKTEQFLMLTYSRAAAGEMRQRLRGLVKKAADYIDIYTFHSFAFAIAEIKGDLEQAGDIIPRAVEMIKNGKAAGKVENKSVLVLDEFQDIGADEFELIRAIIDAAKEIRVIAVGDDDQNIFQFRGSSVEFMQSFEETFKATVYPLDTNFRSKDNLVQFSDAFVQRLPRRVKQGRALVSAYPGQNGECRIVRYRSTHLIPPLVRDVIAGRQLSLSGGGTTAVLTATNEEALQVYHLLRQQGIGAVLTASYGRFDIQDLLELKLFSHLMAKAVSVPAAGGKGTAGKLIDEEQWQAAKEHIRQKFSRSRQLPHALAAIEAFEKEYGTDHLSYTAWKEFLAEIRLEDFMFPEKDVVFVSTMHKAKGKEFDRVFLLLEGYRIQGDESIRVVYVAVTRAREALTIHTDTSIFDGITVPGLQYRVDENVYGEVPRLSFQCTHRDVYLDYFKGEQVAQTVRTIQAGDLLYLSSYDERVIMFDGEEAGRFSTGGWEKLQKFFSKGYRVESMQAECIVIWSKKGETKEFRVVLPRLELRKDL